MEQYKEKLRIQNVITIICCVILLAFIALAILAEAGVIPSFTPVTGDSHWHSRWRGFITGAGCGIPGLMLFSLIRSMQALKDEKKLKKLYIQENDERQIQIWTAARATSMRFFLMLGLIAGIIAGYFSITVSITIIACVFIHSLMGAAFKLYYSKKF